MLTRLLISLVWVATVGSAPPVCGQNGVAQEHQDKVTFADGRVTFERPAGFTALSAEWLALKYPHPGAPREAIGNAKRTTSIAYDLLDQKAPSDDLNVLRRALVESFVQLPKLRWLASDIRRVGSRDFAYLEFTSAASDQDLHNIVLLSVLESRLLIFNFNSTVEEFPRVQRDLRASMATITTKP